MRTPKLYTIGILFIAALACTNQKDLKTFTIFVGKWQLEDSNTFESWENHDTFLSGRVYKIENTDTLIVEKLRIFPDKNIVFYEATVPSQNNGNPVRFKLTQQNNSEFQFENPNHDFPQKIIYTFKNKNELTATISGENKQASFNYRKIN